MAKAKKNWIQGAIKHPGALHKAMHVPMGKTMTVAMLDKAIKKGGVNARRAHMAKTLRKINKY